MSRLTVLIILIVILVLWLILKDLIFTLIRAFLSPKSLSLSTKSEKKSNRTLSATARQDILDDTKDLLEIRLKEESQPVHFEYLGSTNLLEVSFEVELYNPSQLNIQINKISWEVWLGGRHIKSGEYTKLITIEPAKEIKGLVFRDSLNETEVADVFWLKQKPDAAGHIEGMLHVQTGYGKFLKKFTMLELGFIIKGQANERPKGLLAENLLDSVTGLFQKAFLDENLQDIINRKIDEGPISLAMVDIDNLNAINEAHGNFIGDDVLRMVCGKIKSAIAEKGIAIRYGEDMMAIILEKIDSRDAQILGESIRSNVESHLFRASSGDAFHVTVSIGIATIERKLDYQSLVSDAEKMLTLSKRNGKNKVSVSQRKNIRD